MLYRLDNPAQAENQILELVRDKLICCNNNLKKCQFKVNHTGKLSAVVITNVDTNEDETFTIEDYTDGKSLRLAICAALRKAGYVQCEEDDDTTAKARGVHGTFLEGVSMLCLTGEAPIVSFLDDKGEAAEVTELCTPVKVNKIQFAVPLGTETVSVSGTDVAVADIATAAVALEIEGADITAAVVTEGTFIIIDMDIVGDSSLVTVNDAAGVWCSCYNDWVA